MPGLHAMYAPSSAKRWMNCTASAIAISSLGVQDENEAAEAGTAAHDEIERCLGHMNGVEWSERNTIVTPNPEHPAIWGIQLFLNYVSKLPAGRSWVEQRVYLTDEIWGRLDFGHWQESTGLLTIVDFKNGYVPVEADSSQLKVYAAALILTMQLRAVKWVRLVVVQPNDWRPGVPRIKQKIISADELYEFATQAAAVPSSPKTFTAGEHCRYCPLFGRCTATNDLLMHLGVMLQHPANKVPMEMIEPILLCKKPIEDFFKNLERHATKSALAGNVPRGMKIVTGDKHRDWKDPIEARKQIVAELGVDALDIPSPAQAEKAGMDVSTLAYKPEGGPVLAFESDSRRPFARKSAAEMFGAVAAGMK